MSEQKMRSVTDSARKSRQVVEPYQPVWMAHWMRPLGNVAAERCKASVSGTEELNCVSKSSEFSNALDASRNPNELKAVETKTFGSVKSLENEIPCQDTESEEALRQDLDCDFEQGKAVDSRIRIKLSSGFPVANGTSFRRHSSPAEGTSKNPQNWANTHSSATNRGFAALKPFMETVVGSPAHSQPHCDLEKHEFGKGNIIVSPLMKRPSIVPDDQLPSAKLRILDQDHYSKDRSFRDFNRPLLFDAPSTSDLHLPMMQKCSGIPLLPSQFIPSEYAESKKSHYDRYSLQKLPNCVEDMETMRIFSTVDSVEATAAGFPRISKTTHSLLITKKTDANLSKEVFRTTQLITELNGNAPGDIHSLWPFSGQGNRGVKLQPLTSSSNSEEKINVEDDKPSKVAIRNESSADTDTMDMDIFNEENSNPGANRTPSTKIDAAASQEIGHHCKNTGLLDINLDLPTLPAVASSSENARATSSRTQSLEMDMFLAHAEQQPKRKSNTCLSDSLETDPIMRWVNRLKLRSPSSSSQGGTKSPSLAENSSADKMGKFFRRILDSGIVSSEPTPSNEPSKDGIPLDNNGYLSKYNEESTADMVKDDRELLISHAWIKRWLQNKSKVTSKKPETAKVNEATSSKMTPDYVQEKQLPSIAAMALMGKALNGLQSCDLQKRGSFTVWNTQGIMKTL